jgi:rhamnosyltransferase subunit B
MPPRSETADAPRAEFVCLPKCELVPVPPGLDPAGVPFNALLPHAAVLVHHGGIGTTAQAIAAGIPQLIVPAAHDQPDNGVFIRRLGIGDFLLPKAYTSANIEQKLSHLMSPDVKRKCQQRAKELAGRESLEKASLLIEELATKHIGTRELRSNTEGTAYLLK